MPADLTPNPSPRAQVPSAAPAVRAQAPSAAPAVRGQAPSAISALLVLPRR